MCAPVSPKRITGAHAGAPLPPFKVLIVILIYSKNIEPKTRRGAHAEFNSAVPPQAFKERPYEFIDVSRFLSIIRIKPINRKAKALQNSNRPWLFWLKKYAGEGFPLPKCPAVSQDGREAKRPPTWETVIHDLAWGLTRVSVSIRVSPKLLRKASASNSICGCSSQDAAWASQPIMTLLPTTAASSQNMGVG